MEANAQYALHDNESTAPAWAARVRLTPELLDKLRDAPEQVLLKLNVAAGDGASKSRGSKKISLMTVHGGETEEQYELLSFPEDPGINHVCTFRRETADGSAGGYNIYKTGTIHQKLLVQRLLDATEKDRIKDKHAKSVLASKSRSSKLIDSELEKPAKKQRLMTRLSIEFLYRTRKLILPSAMSKEDAKEAKERIEKGFEVEVEQVATPPVEETSGSTVADNEDDEMAPKAFIETTAAAARDAEFHTLFSSGSDDENTGRSRVLQRGKKAAKMAKKTQSALIENKANASKISAGAKERENTGTELSAVAQSKESLASASTIVTPEGVREKSSEPHEVSSADSRPSCEPKDIYALKPIKPSGSGAEVKRARVRSALVSDRVKQARLPDLSFFPYAVVGICQRLANYRGRSVILDESDYDSFVETHEQFRQDWEMLDKYLLDKSTIHVYGRWGVALGLLTLYLVRVFYLNAFHIVTYGLGIYLLNLFIGFLSPQMDMESDGPLLPHKQSEEFRPFTRRVPEFQFWYSTFKATVVSLLMTLSSAFDVPVFWPILLIYFIVLFALTMKRQIKHMWKHNYVPWDHGKQVYKGKKNAK
ncbi:unnamed protein product [Phytophthora lilii]|uniref:Unnamed protein product n=1 Tax=Phytophthora lilii TaxID=2077276 RepID=A0A9W6U4S6_9STRA|nr:unnamed protein product [Phytophthora lilii]